MFDFFRNNIKFLMGFLMLLIIPSFVMFGVEGYSSFRQNNEAVAEVGGTRITRPEWDAAHQRETERLLATMPTLDRALLESDEARYGTLERLVTERVLALAAEKDLLMATDQRLVQALTQDPNIASLRKPDGSLDMDRYKEVLGAQGLTPAAYEASVRQAIARQQVTQGVTATGIMVPGVAQQALQAFFERRDIQVARFNPADFKAKVALTDADLNTYYDAHKNRFQIPEQVDLEYLVLDMDAVARHVKINESDLKAYYDQNNAGLSSREERRASHILLTFPAGADSAAKAEVKAKAQAVLDQLQKDPKRFAELAKAQSQDPGSAARGGDLDFFGRGAMVKPFEDAAYSLKKGELSGLVESEFGYHIITVTDIRRPEPEPFAKVRPALEQELRKQQAQRQYAEAAETFTNTVYEQGDSLAPAAKALGLTVQTRNGLLRGGNPGDTSVLSNKKLLATLFNEDNLRQKRNTEAVETGVNQLVAARVVQHRPAQTRPLADVATEVRAQLTQERALALAVAEGKALQAAWAADGASAKLAAPVVVSRAQPQGLPTKLVTAALTAGTATLPAWTGVDLGPDGYAVVRVNKVLTRDTPADAQVQREVAELGQLWSQAETKALVESLKARFKVRIDVKKPAAAGAGVAG
jgi:peptidyl-prolyl cis-trans isomerase D